jgi:hypothetical protein
MALTLDEYRFTIAGVRFYPNESFSVKWEKYADEVFFRRELSTLIFANDRERGVVDFDSLWILENSSARCNAFPLEVERICNGTWEPFISGSLHLVDGYWQLSDCRIDIPVRPRDKYSCTLDNWEKPVNVFAFVPQSDLVTLSTLPPGIEYEIETIQCSDFGPEVDIGAPVPPIPESPPAPCDGSNVWSLLRWGRRMHLVFDNGPGGGPPTGKRWATIAVYVRLVALTNSQPADDWSLINGNWVKAPNIGVAPISDGWNEIGSSYWKIVYDGIILDKVYDNGIKIEDFMSVLVDRTCEGMAVESKFFGINTDQENINDAYGYAIQFLSELVVYQKTDIKYSDAAENATSFIGTDNPLTLKKVMDDMKKWCNVYWDIVITETGPKMIIEHYSYFARQGDWDLTVDPMEKFIRGGIAYKYKTDKLPKSESFQYQDDVSNDFKGVDIFYDNACITNQSELTHKKYKCEFTSNDLPWMSASPEDVDNSGIAFVTAEEDFTIIRNDFIPVINKLQLNGALSFYNLIPSLMLWKRPHLNGLVNNSEVTFYNQTPPRSHDPLKIHLCCESLLSMTTQMKKIQVGWAEVNSIELAEPGGIITLNLDF